MPEGAQRYGSTPGADQSSMVPSYAAGSGTELAPPSGVQYGMMEDRCTAVKKDGNGCLAPKANKTEFCVGHLRQLEKLQREEKQQAEIEPEQAPTQE